VRSGAPAGEEGTEVIEGPRQLGDIRVTEEGHSGLEIGGERVRC
jgi:hypothetical protein